MAQSMTLTQGFASEGVYWPITLTAKFTPDLETLNDIDIAQRLMKTHPYITSITIKDNNIEIYEREIMDKEMRVGDSEIVVYAACWYWKAYSKYDQSAFAEYCIEDANSDY